MFCTPDFEVKEILEFGEYFGKIKVGVEVPEKYIEAFFNSDVTGFSTRSRLARVFTDLLYNPKPPYKEEKEIVAELEYINRGFPVIYLPGDKVGRFYAYNKDDRVHGEELDEIILNNPGMKVIDPGIVKVKLKNNVYYKPKKLDYPIKAEDILKRPNEFIEKYEDKFNWFLFITYHEIFSEPMLVETEEISIPNGYYGLIKDTTFAGNTRHSNSRVIDPCYKGSLFAEINVGDRANIFAKEHGLLIEIYRATDID